MREISLYERLPPPSLSHSEKSNAATVGLYITMGIIDRERNAPARSRGYFEKALRIQPNNREASWHLSQLPAEEEKGKADQQHRGRSVLCAICMNEEAYIDEWVDYHLGIGFQTIIIYDNTFTNDLRQWGQRRGNETRTKVIHYPGLGMQGQAYLHCAELAMKQRGMKWAGFWDIDEFLVLKKHDNVDDFLHQHLDNGALSINWYMFGPSGNTIYEPSPVTKRFVYREREVNNHVKSFVLLSDMNKMEESNPHFPKLIRGAQHDTTGREVEGPFNDDGPSDVAVLHHYATKSYNEYIQKRVRGRADQAGWTPSHPGPEYQKRINFAKLTLKEAILNDGNVHSVRDISGNDKHISGSVPQEFDDSAWELLKKVAPKYALYEKIY